MVRSACGRGPDHPGEQFVRARQRDRGPGCRYGEPSFQTADGDEYRFCETKIKVADVCAVWARLTGRCVPAPEPPVTDLVRYEALVAGLPPRFWTRNSESEIEYVGQLGANQLTNLGTVERTRGGFKVTANSVRRAAELTTIVLATATDAGHGGKVAGESVRTAEELLGENRTSRAQSDRELMCRRLGIDPGLVAVPPRKLILEEQFLPMEHTPAGEAADREITRELAARTMLAVKDEEGLHPGRGSDSRRPGERTRCGGNRRLRVADLACRTSDGRSHAASR